MNNSAASLVASMLQRKYDSISPGMLQASQSRSSGNSSYADSFTNVYESVKSKADFHVKDDAGNYSKDPVVSHTKIKTNDYNSTRKNTDDKKTYQNDSPSQNAVDESRGPDKSSNDVGDTKGESGETADTTGAVNANQVDKASEDLKDSKDVQKAQNNLETLMEAIASMLNITPEQLQESMKDLDLSAEDLFDFENVKLLTAEVYGLEEPTQLLLVDGAMETMSDVMATLKDALQANPDLLKSEENSMSENQNMMDGSTEEEMLVGLMKSQNESSSGEGQGQEQSSDTVLETKQELPSIDSQTTEASGGFENLLNQVMTTKTQTIVMDGQVQTIQTQITAKDVFDQIVTGMKVQVTETTSNLTLQLQPENLGKISLNLVHENGGISGQFIAESEAVKEVIEANLSQLKAQLTSQGIEVNELKITVGNTAAYFTGNNEENQNSQNEQKSGKRSRTGNVNDIYTDNINEDIEDGNNNQIHENSSIELHA